jgi:hypothetical protein
VREKSRWWKETIVVHIKIPYYLEFAEGTEENTKLWEGTGEKSEQLV